MGESVSTTGRSLGPYRLAQCIGQGGMGVVHLALDPDGRAVAVKVLRPHVAADPEARERLAREVDTLTRVRSPRVAEVLDADVDCDTPYVVTRYVPAPPLDRFVADRGPLGPFELARLGLGLGEALAAIHRVDVVHRDLKPANVLMLDGDPVVIDFGIAHVADDIRLTSTGLVMGTPGYLSPELVEGAPVHQAADWWGWAATLAFAATGRPPFGRGPLELVLDRVRRGTPDLDGVPSALVPVLHAALSPRPADRPRPGALRRAAEQLRADAGAGVVPLAPAPRPQDARTQVVPVGPGPASDAATTVVPGPPVVPPPAPPEQATLVVPFVPPTRAVPLPPPPAQQPLQQPVQQPVQQPRPVPPQAFRPVPQHQTQHQPQHQTQHQPQPWPPPQPHRRDQPPPTFGGPLPGVVEQHRPPVEVPPPARSRRAGTLLGGLVLLVCLAAALPVVAAAVGVGWLLLARTVDAASGSLMRRRYERGARRGDAALAVLASPYHLLVQVLLLVPVLLLPAAVALASAFLPGLFVDLTAAPWATSVALAAGGLGACLTAWWGIGGSSLRRGARQLARGLAPGRGGSTLAVVAALSLAGGALVLLAMWGWVPSWEPLPGPATLLP